MKHSSKRKMGYVRISPFCIRYDGGRSASRRKSRLMPYATNYICIYIVHVTDLNFLRKGISDLYFFISVGLHTL